MGNKTKVQVFLGVDQLKYVDELVDKYNKDGIVEHNRSIVINLELRKRLDGSK